jgi:hypothetical protein
VQPAACRYTYRAILNCIVTPRTLFGTQQHLPAAALFRGGVHCPLASRADCAGGIPADWTTVQSCCVARISTGIHLTATARRSAVCAVRADVRRPHTATHRCLQNAFPRDRGWGGVDWTALAQDRHQWRALVNTAMNLRVP